MSKLTLENIYEDYNKKDRNQINRINELQNSLERESERVSQLLRQVKFGDNSCLSACEIRQVVDDRIETVLNNADIYLQSINQSVLGTLTFIATDPEVPPIDVNLCPHVQYCETDTTLAKVPASLSLSYSAEKHTDTVDLSSWFTASNIFWSGSVTGFPNSNVQDMLDDIIGDANLPVDCTYFSGSQGNAITLSLDDLSDVNTIGLPINVGDYLRWDGNNWVPSPTTTPFNCSMLSGCSLSSGDGVFESVNSNTLIREKTATNQYQRDFLIGSPQLGDNGNSAHYSRMFFDKSKGAFRAGWVNDTDWDDVNVGYYSVAFGVSNRSLGQHSFSAGSSNEATDNSSIALGYGNTSSGLYSFTSNQGNKATSLNSSAINSYNESTNEATFAHGYNSKAYLKGMKSHSFGKFADVGDAQSTEIVLRQTSTDSTPIILGLNASITTAGAVILNPNRTYCFEIKVGARQVSGLGNIGDSAFYILKGVITSDGANNTTLKSTAKDIIYEDQASWDVNVFANDSIESLQLEVTGEAGKTIHWVGHIQFIEIG